MNSLLEKITSFRELYGTTLRLLSQGLLEDDLDHALRILVASRKSSDEISRELSRETVPEHVRAEWQETVREMGVYLLEIERHLHEIKDKTGRSLNKLDRGHHGLQGYRNAAFEGPRVRLDEEI